MKTLLVAAVVTCAALGSAQSKVVGVWKPGIKLPAGKLSPQQMKVAKAAKSMAETSSLKLNKDKTFGAKMGKIMYGDWSQSGNVITINVTSIVGFSDRQVKAMSASQRVAKFRVEKNGMLTTLPVQAGKPILVWKKTKA